MQQGTERVLSAASSKGGVAVLLVNQQRRRDAALPVIPRLSHPFIDSRYNQWFTYATHTCIACPWRRLGYSR